MIYGTFIKVITGFYMGCVGVVVEHPASYYMIDMSCRVGNEMNNFSTQVEMYEVEQITSDEYYAKSEIQIKPNHTKTRK